LPRGGCGGIQEEIAAEEEAKERYRQMAKRLEQEVEEYKLQVPELDRELEELRCEEEKLKEKLKSTESKRSEIAAEMARQREREEHLKAEEQSYWESFNEYQRKVLEFREEQRSIDYQLQYMTEQLDRLKKTNVLNSAFHIWHNGHFGTINGLRLGRLQTVPVEWSEINAALGQAALLLVTLARNAGAAFVRYKVMPYGNQSFVEVLEGKKKNHHWPLYSSAGLRIFADSKFDLGLVAYLDCLNQLKQHIEISSKSRFALPYTISKDRIGNGKEFYSIKTQFNTPEGWTKALKFVLTNLRWALTWISANNMQLGSS
jgi:beclin 1